MKKKKLYALYRIHHIDFNMDYIGWSSDSINRVFEQHEKANSYIGNTICTYGWSAFDVDVLHLVKIKEEVLKLEVEEIAKHNCQAPNGYNLTPGGEGISFEGHHHTEKTKEKMRKAMKGKKKPGTSKAMQGKKHGTGKRSEKAKQKMRGKKKPGTSKAMKKNNPSKCLNVKIKKLQNRIAKLENGE